MVLGGGALGVLAPLLAFGLDRIWGREVMVIVDPYPPEVVEVQKWEWEEGGRKGPVAAIYGNPTRHPIRVLLPDSSRVYRPEEDPSLRLLPVHKSRGENPLQVQTLWFFVRWTLIAAFLGVSIGAVLLWMQAGRKTLEKNRIDLRTYLKEMP